MNFLQVDALMGKYNEIFKAIEVVSITNAIVKLTGNDVRILLI